ncbi:MAG: pyridoxamine 5'-phosphate oxidase family protein [Pseudomonadota bacterium]
MGDAYEALNEKHIAFIREQKLFFVATAPLSADGCVNLSPKGYDSLSVIDPHTLVWIDLGGSGIETLAHVRENARMTLMFCAFEGRANILRVYGRAEAISFDEPGFDDLIALFPQFDRARSIFRLKVSRVSDSCGWGVPFYEFKGEREQLRRWVGDKPAEEWREKRYAKNAESIDGLPGLVRPGEAPKDGVGEE